MTAGAVNIITKTQKENGFSTSIRGAGGPYNTFIESIEHGGKIKNTDYYLLQSFKQSSGHRENAGGELQDYFGHIGHQLSDKWKVSFTANATQNSDFDAGWAPQAGLVLRDSDQRQLCLQERLFHARH